MAPWVRAGGAVTLISACLLSPDSRGEGCGERLRSDARQTARWSASRWPQDRRVPGVSFTVHNILAGIVDDEERCATIPGSSPWTCRGPHRVLGNTAPEGPSVASSGRPWHTAPPLH
ncbi:DUF6192 family protein [Streptomyces sp. NY05-11A]|uniref:DUF6192 family protein n=1 Tax=Streptomyces soliscabiei TaxID=588897 RepID=UPI0029C0AC0F|nr:DUF6192 family protein [Streptomyces sp. NY05-11A]